MSQLAELTGHTLVRINLSEHSEISDLLGTDMPIESNSGGSSSQLNGPKFVFCKYIYSLFLYVRTYLYICALHLYTVYINTFIVVYTVYLYCILIRYIGEGIFLKAMQEGHWVLLDELNLAPQSVLEGLNACLDHRGEVYLPEISK